MDGDIWLGVFGSEILLSRAGLRFTPSDIESIVENRTIDNTLVSDLKGVKKHFEIAYDPATTGTNLTALLALYNLHVDLNLIVTNEDETTTAYTVVLRPIPRGRMLVSDVWLWSGVTLILDEV